MANGIDFFYLDILMDFYFSAIDLLESAFISRNNDIELLHCFNFHPNGFLLHASMMNTYCSHARKKTFLCNKTIVLIFVCIFCFICIKTKTVAFNQNEYCFHLDICCKYLRSRLFCADWMSRVDLHFRFESKYWWRIHQVVFHKAYF